MRISVRSSIMSKQPLPGLSLFKGFAAVPKQARASACSPQEATPSPGEPVNRGRALIGPGCGEEIILFEGPLSVAREEYRVAPMAGDGTAQESWPASLSPPSVPSRPPGRPRLPALRQGARTRGLAAKPVWILTGG